MIKKIFCFIIACFMCFSLNLVVNANQVPSVIFDRDTKKFTFENTVKADEIDLFTNFKNLVPGDNITQNINLKIKNTKKEDVINVYLQSKTTDKTFTDLLKSIKITYKNQGKNISTSLQNKVLLGAFSKDEIRNISVKIEIPLETGNEIKNLLAETQWIFTAEILTDTNLPQTGDENHLIWFLLIGFLSLIVLVYVVYKKAKK